METFPRWKSLDRSNMSNLAVNESALSNITNQTVLNGTVEEVPSEETDKKTIQMINFVILATTALPLVCTGFSLWVVLLCKKLPPHLKYTSVSFLLSSFLGFLGVIIFRIVIYVLNIRHPKVESAQFLCAGLFFTIGSSTVTHMSVDRLFAVTFALFHKKFMTSRHVKGILYGQWLVISVVLLSVWALSEFYLLNGISRPKFNMYYRRLHVGFLLVFPSCTIMSCAAVLYKLTRSKSEWFQKKIYRITKILIMVIVMHTILGMPFVVHFAILEIAPKTSGSWRAILHTAGYLCSIANAIFNAFYYTLNVRECRDYAANFFCHWKQTNNNGSKS